MVIEMALTFSLCKSKILFLAIILLHHICKLLINMIPPFHWTFHFFSAIAFRSLVTWFRCDLFIMPLDDCWFIVHATVADFNCIAVESFVKFVAPWKMFCYQLKECLYNVCWNGCAKGPFKPYYVSLLWFLCFWFVVGVFQMNIITRML